MNEKMKELIIQITQLIGTKNFDLIGSLVKEAYEQGLYDGINTNKEVNKCSRKPREKEVKPE